MECFFRLDYHNLKKCTYCLEITPILIKLNTTSKYKTIPFGFFAHGSLISTTHVPSVALQQLHCVISRHLPTRTQRETQER